MPYVPDLRIMQLTIYKICYLFTIRSYSVLPVKNILLIFQAS